MCVCKAEVVVSTFWMENRAIMKTHGHFMKIELFGGANPNPDNLPFANV